MFHVAGDIIDTDVNEICAALRETDFAVRVNGDEARIRRDDANFHVYPYRPGNRRGEDFLVSGGIDDPEPQARACLETIAHALASAGLVYNFEVDREGESTTSFVISHPDFG